MIYFPVKYPAILGGDQAESSADAGGSRQESQSEGDLRGDRQWNTTAAKSHDSDLRRGGA